MVTMARQEPVHSPGGAAAVCGPGQGMLPWKVPLLSVTSGD